jgi:hypothetical protein
VGAILDLEGVDIDVTETIGAVFLIARITMPAILAGATGQGALAVAVTVFFTSISWQEVDVGRVDYISLNWLEWRESCHVEAFQTLKNYISLFYRFNINNLRRR